jgi:hypothetical protein
MFYLYCLTGRPHTLNRGLKDEALARILEDKDDEGGRHIMKS